MPALLWVAFWSSMMGAAACWDGGRRPIRKDPIGEDEDVVKKPNLSSAE
jgi:hypothetical protein